MNIINYIDLYKYLKNKEQLSNEASLRNILRIRLLPKEFKQVVLEIIEDRLYNVGEFSVDNVTLKSLVQKEGMKCIQAVLFLDWLRREPDNARAFMSSKRFRSPLQTFNEEEMAMLKEKLNALSEQQIKDASSWQTPEDNSEKDIEIESDNSTENALMD